MIYATTFLDLKSCIRRTMLTGLEDDLSEEQLLLQLLPCFDDNLHAYNGIDMGRLNWTRGLLVLLCCAESSCTADKLKEDGRCGAGATNFTFVPCFVIA